MSHMRWLTLYLLWNMTASVIFIATHETMRSEQVPGFVLPLLFMAMATAGYCLLYGALRKDTSRRTELLVRWTQGFHILFWAEAIMEGVVFTLLNFHDTEANDPYFVAFWALVLLWTIGGWPWLSRQMRPPSSR